MTEFVNAQTAKVIKGLEECSKADFNSCMDRICPYAPKNTNNFCNCRIHLLIDALELLKTQRETIDELISADKALKLMEEHGAKWIEYPDCLAYDGAYSDSHIVCSACKHVFSIMDNCTEEFDYCPHCGAKMEGQ